MMKLKEIRTWLNTEKGKQSQVESDLKEVKTRAKQNRVESLRNEQALTIIREIGLQTQQQLQYFIAEITSLALESVFENPYSLKVDFVERRNRTECDLSFERDGKEYDPMSSTGGGAVDIASLSLRISSWSMKSPKYRSTLILDEPLKNLSEKHKQAGAEMIKEISERLGIQFIIVTHENVLSQAADRVFSISKSKRGVSKVKEI